MVPGIIFRNILALSRAVMKVWTLIENVPAPRAAASSLVTALFVGPISYVISSTESEDTWWWFR